MRDGERAVAILPMGEIWEDTLLLDPTARGSLDVLHQISQGDGWMNLRQDVNVILYAADPVEVTVLVFQNAPSVAEEIIAPVCQQHPFAILRREDDVILDLGEGGHVSVG